MFRGFWNWGLHIISLLPCLASFRSTTLLQWSSSDMMYSSSSWKSSSIVLGFSRVKCEARQGSRDSALVLLFYHLPRESRISAAWIFLRSFVAVLCLSACSCTDLMTWLLFHEISGMLEWTLSWDRPSCRLSVAVAESTSSELDLRRQWWRI
jgi:hypothetical protein